MNKGAKGRPRIKTEILNRIIALVLSNPHLLGKEIQAQLENEFDPNDVPRLRTIYKYVSDARKQAERNDQDKPWSLGTMDKINVPWDAADWLLECYKKCEKHIEEYQRRLLDGEKLEDEPLWRYTNPYPMGTKPFEPVEGGYVFLTNRQAKWLWRIRHVMPAQELNNSFLKLCRWADQYAYAEIIADYLDQYFDTRTIDADLMVHRQLSTENEVNREQTAEKEE